MWTGANTATALYAAINLGDNFLACVSTLYAGCCVTVIVLTVLKRRRYDADSVRSCIRDQGAIPNIPNRSNRKKKFRWKKAIYRQRNHVERFFNKLKQFRRIAPPLRQARSHLLGIHPACRHPHFPAIN
jgi:transposase